ncbi:MAG: strawberry notch family protein, partial [Pseudomonadota bacterium]
MDSRAKENIQDDRDSQRHKNLVTLAVTEGKPVPVDVLKDYPELSAQSAAIENTGKANPVESNTPEGWGRVPGGGFISKEYGNYLISGEQGQYRLSDEDNGQVIGGVYTDPQTASNKANQHWIDKQKTSEKKSSPQSTIATKVKDRIKSNRMVSPRQLFSWSDEAYGGTQAQNAYSVKDAYDAAELGINMLIAEQATEFSPDQDRSDIARSTVKKLGNMTALLPTQTKRTKEQQEYQQFSTPPALAFIVSWIAKITGKDIVLEPSAGIGGIAVFAKNAGAKVYVNELSDRRAAFLKELGFDGIFQEDAAQLDNILPDDVKPTVIVMNPPFSSTAGRTKNNKTMNGAKHIEQALARLQPGGRLVAIVGQGMSMDSAQFKSWWSKISDQYDVRANIGVSGKEYGKYGTTFDNQILVIDKSDQTGNIITGKVDSFVDLVNALSGLRKEDRYAATTPEANTERKPDAGQPSGETGTKVRQGTSGRPVSPRPATDDVGSGKQGVVRNGNSKGGAGNVDVPVQGQSASTKDNVNDRSVANETTVERPQAVSPGPDSGTGSVDQGREPGLRPGRDAGNETDEQLGELTDSVYDKYVPNAKVAGSRTHITPLVESAAMADTKPPKTDYSPDIPKSSIESGKLTDAQLEAIIYAGRAHQKKNPDGTRKGFFIGDGTGVGKGREISGIILDNWRRGKKKVIWISEKSSLLKDAKRDLAGIGWNEGADKTFGLGDVAKLGEKVTREEGILFTQYATLRGGFKKIRTDIESSLNDMTIRLNQIVDWVGKDFDGVIAFDEAHNMGNAIQKEGERGTKDPAAQAMAGILLQKLLPNAKVVYVSATGATEVSNLAYAPRLGLWGEGTPFKNVNDFIDKIQGSGVSAMELVARDMKSLGLYIARSLSYADVKYDRVEHALSQEQTKIYDTLARSWQTVLQNINAAIEITEGGKNARAVAMGQFWGAHQRFFNQIITAMQMPSALAQMEKDLAAGNAVIVQLVNTNAQQQERKIAELPEDMTAEDLDMTPRETLMQFLDRSFPTQQFEEYTDEDGKKQSRPVYDSNGNPVHNKEAIAMKNRLMLDVGGIAVPDTALDMIIHKFGTDKVGEITGRSRRVVIDKDGKKIIEKWSDAKGRKDIADFMDDKKSILIFSDKGGTGSSYQADLNAKNQRLRRHYLIQPGWRADKAVQGLGRSHRSNQKQAPEFVLVTTDLPGQKRFLSSIARRLDQLGALTKGQRQTGSQGVFAAKDNLESSHSTDALHNFFKNMTDREYDDVTPEDFQAQTGITLIDKDGNVREEAPPMTQFLNRILSMTKGMQENVFNHFSEELDKVIDFHTENGTLDVGLETITAESIRKTRDEVAYKDDAENVEARYIQFDVDHPAQRLSFDDTKVPSTTGYYVNQKSGKIRFAGRVRSMTDPDTGVVEKYVVLQNPRKNSVRVPMTEFAEKYEKVDKGQAEAIWNTEYSELPTVNTEKLHILTGTLLPLWDRVGGSASVVRLQTDSGERFLGRKIQPSAINTVLDNLGVGREAITMSGDQVAKAVLSGSSVQLHDNTKFKRSKVNNENRIEFVSTDDFVRLQADELEKAGLFSEMIQWKTRWFVPAGENAGAVIDKVMKGKDIVSVQNGKPQFSTGQAQLPGQGVTLQDLQRLFKGQAVGIGPDKSIWVRLKNGKGLVIHQVNDMG